MTMNSIVVLFCVLGVSAAQTLTIDPVGAVTVVEGNNLTITCTDGVNEGARFLLRENGVRLTGVSRPPTQVNGLVRIYQLPVDIAKNGNSYECEEAVLGMISAMLSVTVVYPPQFSPSTATATPTEGGQLTLSFSIDANPPPSSDNITLTRSGTPVTDARVTVTTTSLTIADVTRSDSGEYQITASNVAGSATFTLTVDVYYPPEFTVPSQNVTRNAARNEVFTFDCTPSDGNPAVYSYTFLKGSVPVTDGVSGPVLAINPVVRSSRGMYTCTANNTAGTAVITRNLFVVDVPTMPLNPRVVDLMPFSVTLQWDPPSDNGGSPLPLAYTVTLTNTSTSLSFSDITTTSLPLPHLQHSTQYSWSVQAINEFHTGPPAEGTFRTNDTVPTVSGVEAIALTLDTVQVDVTVSDDGGQPVLEYTVTVNGTTVMFSRPRGNVTGLSLMNGATYTVSMVARNSIGDSEIFTGSFSIPFPPNITMQPVVVTPDETTTRCCAGVRVFLEHPSDPTLVFTAQVSTEGSPFTARNVTREGDVVYVQGLQAGRPYSIRLTGWNNFGRVTKEVSSTPLIGSPSDPSMPVVSVEGSSVSIQLSTRYPGTNARGQFRFSLIFSAASTAKRQSLQPTEVRVDPTGLDSSVTTTHTLTDVAAGSYSVSVKAENENGMSEEMTATFVVQGSCPESTDLLPAVVALSVVLAIVVLLLALAIPTIIFLCTRNQKLSSVLKAVKDPNYHYADVEMESHNLPKSHSKSTTEPQYEECGGGVTGSNVAMEDNPAYQSVDVAAAKS